MEEVLVLLSTYNGEKYLEQQLDCLRNQKFVKLKLLVRDDGSKDETLQILKKYQKKMNMEWYTGENLGPANSFMDLIVKASGFQYYAFCDQDDIWDEEKLYQAIKKIKKINQSKEILYYSSATLVDKELNFIKLNEVDRKYQLTESLMRNNAQGATMVFNKKMLDTLKIHKPIYIEMHDSWTYRVCKVVSGNIILDKNSYIQYRQHENNVIGTGIGPLKRFINRVNNFRRTENVGLKTATELLDGYEHKMSQDNKKKLREIVIYKKKFKNKIVLLKDENFRIGKKYQRLLFILDVLFGKF